MTTRNLGRAEQDRYIKELEAQGCRVRYGGRGSKLVVYAPDGGSTTIHFTTSDIKSLQASISWFRRHGLRHPDDTKEVRVEREDPPAETDGDPYPDYVKGKLSNTIRTKALALLREQGWPSEVTVKALPGMDPASAAKALYAIGYRWPEGTAGGQTGPKARVWHAPEEIRKLAAQAAEESKDMVQAPEERPNVGFGSVPSPADVARSVRHREPVPEKAWEKPTPPRPTPTIPEFAKAITQAVAAQAPEPEPEVKPTGGREFIDTVDSWTVDTRGASITDRHPMVPEAVRNYLDGLRAAGLEVEIRVWRKDH